MSGSGDRPAQGPKGEVKESNAGAAGKSDSQKVHNDIANALSGISHTTPGGPGDNRPIDDMKLHQVLKKLMLKNKDSARSAARSCGVPLSTFNSYLKPKKQIDPAHVIAIANYYSVTVDYLLTGKKPRDETFKSIPTKKLFSRWVKLTIEDLADEDDSAEKEGEK